MIHFDDKTIGAGEQQVRLSNIFFKYFFKYLVSFLFILLSCTYIAYLSFDIVEDQIMEKNEMKFREGINEIDQNLSKMYLLTENIRQDSHVQYLINTKGAILKDRYLEIGNASKILSESSLIYTFPVYCFMLFRDNDIYVSSSQSSALFSEYYGAFLIAEGDGVLKASEFKQKLFEGNGIYTFQTVDKIIYNYNNKACTLNKAILCTIKGSTRLKNGATHAMTFVLSPEQLINMLLTDESREKGFLQIVDSSNHVLLQYGNSAQALQGGKDQELVEYGGEKYRLLTYTASEAGWKVSIGFPYSIVKEQVKDIVDVILIYVFAGFLLVIGLAYYFSSRQYSGVRKLFVTISNGGDSLGRGKDEYDILNHALNSITENKNQYKAQMELLDQQNQALLLENLIVRGINTVKEGEEFKRYFARPIEYFCVALMKMKVKEPEEHQIALICIMEYLKECYPNDFANVHSGISDELFLFSLSPKDASNVNNIKSLFDNIVNVLMMDMDIIFNIGISAIGTDISNVNACYQQAQQVTHAFYSEFANSVETYTVNINQAKDNIVGMDFLTKLSNLILSGEKNELHQQFAKVINNYQKMPLQYEIQKEQIFFAIRNVIYHTCLQIISEPQEQIKLPDYYNESMERLFQSLERSSFELCDLMEAKKKSRNNELKDNIVTYIRENYKNPSVNAVMVSQRFKISEKYLGQFIKEQTGETYAAYLEQVRIQHAMEYLSTTDWSNEKIAEETGFTALNTFYRVFHKLTGVSPGAYRASRGNRE